MNTLARLVNYFFVISPISIYAVPPELCFQKFRWDDCGKAPVPVMYYWQPGSRCEVGMWRGCLPNLNMFPDEYTCINTCIFGKRAGSNDYEFPKDPEMSQEEETEFNANSTEITNNTITDGNSTEVDTKDSNSTDIDHADNSTTEASGDGPATDGTATEDGTPPPEGEGEKKEGEGEEKGEGETTEAAPAE
ncbi:hypothetical protein ABMA28_013851 [Loxostege sticticalis]|uniref:BPTI/Kunitz inhibitor domain-containing protein n=1 Tax=Loxostege sticticalis TaxID=481309 RepID=A0ABD0TK27_LOXSC